MLCVVIGDVVNGQAKQSRKRQMQQSCQIEPLNDVPLLSHYSFMGTIIPPVCSTLVSRLFFLSSRAGMNNLFQEAGRMRNCREGHGPDEELPKRVRAR